MTIKSIIAFTRATVEDPDADVDVPNIEEPAPWEILDVFECPSIFEAVDPLLLFHLFVAAALFKLAGVLVVFKNGFPISLVLTNEWWTW